MSPASQASRRGAISEPFQLEPRACTISSPNRSNSTCPAKSARRHLDSGPSTACAVRHSGCQRASLSSSTRASGGSGRLRRTVTASPSCRKRLRPRWAASASSTFQQQAHHRRSRKVWPSRKANGCIRKCDEPRTMRSQTSLLPEEIVKTWRNQIVLKPEDPEDGTPGLRSPQIGAVYATLAHWGTSDKPATVVMPTGTGKTETMLALLVAAELGRLLVVVPNDNLRGRSPANSWGNSGHSSCGCARRWGAAAGRRCPAPPAEDCRGCRRHLPQGQRRRLDDADRRRLFAGTAGADG